jgi:hypothetical protein
MLTAYQGLIETHEEIFKRGVHTPQLVIVLDEATILRKAILTRSYPYLPSDVLCRAISRYSKHVTAPIWVVFASTESKIADFAAPNVKCKW